MNDVEDTMMTVRTHSNCRQDSGHDTALLAFDEDGLSLQTNSAIAHWKPIAEHRISISNMLLQSVLLVFRVNRLSIQ